MLPRACASAVLALTARVAGAGGRSERQGQGQWAPQSANRCPQPGPRGGQGRRSDSHAAHRVRPRHPGAVCRPENPRSQCSSEASRRARHTLALCGGERHTLRVPGKPPRICVQKRAALSAALQRSLCLLDILKRAALHASQMQVLWMARVLCPSDTCPLAPCAFHTHPRARNAAVRHRVPSQCLRWQHSRTSRSSRQKPSSRPALQRLSTGRKGVRGRTAYLHGLRMRNTRRTNSQNSSI